MVERAGWELDAPRPHVTVVELVGKVQVYPRHLGREDRCAGAASQVGELQGLVVRGKLDEWGGRRGSLYLPSDKRHVSVESGGVLRSGHNLPPGGDSIALPTTSSCRSEVAQQQKCQACDVMREVSETQKIHLSCLSLLIALGPADHPRACGAMTSSFFRGPIFFLPSTTRNKSTMHRAASTRWLNRALRIGEAPPLAGVPVYLCPSLGGHALRHRLEVRRTAHGWANRARAAPSRHAHTPPTEAPAELPRKIPMMCTGCGAFSQASEPGQLGYFDTERRRIRDWLSPPTREKKESSSNQDKLVNDALQSLESGKLEALGLSPSAMGAGEESQAEAMAGTESG